MRAALSAIAEPTRFEIVGYLRGGPRSVGEIALGLGLSQPQASKHLRVLSEAGIVDSLPKAQLRLYSLRAQPFIELGAWLDSFNALWNERLDRLDSLPRELGDDKL